MKLTKAELAAKGHAFDYGYEAQRAKRLFQEGIGHTPADDLALALGYPNLVELAPDAEGDPVELTKARISLPDRQLVPWPRNLAVRAARAIANCWDEFPKKLSAEAVEALQRDDDFHSGEEVELLKVLFEIPSASWDHVAELCFLLEALAGGEAVAGALVDSMEADPGPWNNIDSSRWTMVHALGSILDRLTEERAAPFRPRLEALIEIYKEDDPDLGDPEYTTVPLRALDVVLHGGLGYKRSAGPGENGPTRAEAIFLSREEFRTLTTPPGEPEPDSLPTVQWVVQGGIGELQHMKAWREYELKGSKQAAYRTLSTQLARLSAPEAAALAAAIAAALKPKSS